LSFYFFLPKANLNTIKNRNTINNNIITPPDPNNPDKGTLIISLAQAPVPSWDEFITQDGVREVLKKHDASPHLLSSENSFPAVWASGTNASKIRNNTTIVITIVTALLILGPICALLFVHIFHFPDIIRRKKKKLKVELFDDSS